MTTFTREALTRVISEAGKSGYLVSRKARKPHKCVCAAPMKDATRPNPNYRAGCLEHISPGTAYVEYVGEVVFQSGNPYCAPCAVAVWLSDSGTAPLPTQDELVAAYSCVTCGSRKFEVMDEGGSTLAFTCNGCGDEWYEKYAAVTEAAS